MDVPSMVQRSGDTLIVRSVVSGDQIFLDQETGSVVNTTTGPIYDYLSHSRLENTMSANNNNCNNRSGGDGGNADVDELMDEQIPEPKDEGLPQCKIKRNYSCNSCTFFTQNPRYHLSHLRDVHGEKIVIHDCKLCVYASRHYQKLVRHMKMVHNTLDGIEDHNQTRKRNSNREGRKRKIEQNPTNASPVNHDTPQEQRNQLQQQLQLKFQQQQQQIQQQFQQKQQPDHQQQFAQQETTTHNQLQSPNITYEEQNREGSPQNRILKCSVCDFTTLFREQLVEHEQEDHFEKKFFRCEKCSYVTHIKARFSKHVKYHSMPMIKCDVCDFRTPYKWNLDRHMKNHNGNGPFRCAACNFTADIKQSLTVHEMNHHVPPVGNAAGISMTRRRNKVGGTDIICDDFLSENGDLDGFNNNNNIDDFDEPPYTKKCKYPDDDQPTDLSQRSSSSIDASTPPISTPQPLKKATRPVPNLIPINPGSTSGGSVGNNGNALNLSKTFFDNFDDSKNTFKDIASFFFPDGKIPAEAAKLDKIDNPQLSPTSSNSSSTTNSKKRNATNFFKKLKETFEMDAAKNENLICTCGYTSKCLSESIIHRNSCQRIYENHEKLSSPLPINLSVNNSGSTRCQHCRHRCKSSADLVNHLKICTEISGRSQQDSLDSISDHMTDKRDDDMVEEHQMQQQQQSQEAKEKHPMENKVFVWNNVTIEDKRQQQQENQKESSNKSVEESTSKTSPASSNNNNENGYYGVETAPGYGEVTKKMNPEEEAANSSLKKVYKCPHCSFWASTASRFHVHIVGHLNKKPFECSLCAYRSNWRWDITKHIRLKTIRDPNHKNAKVLMNDETGRRNYTKYNKYITLMKVTEEDGDPKLMKSGEMTPNQEASLAFLNDRKKAETSTGTSSNIGGISGNVNPLVRFQFPLPLLLSQTQQQKQQSSQSQQQQHNQEKRSPPLLLKPSEEVIDVKSTGSDKKTLYKCRKCDFKHANRDTVLTHVRTHYQEAGIELSDNQNLSAPLQFNSNLYMNNVFAAMCLSQQAAAGKSIIPGQIPGLLGLSTAAMATSTNLNKISNSLMPINLGSGTGGSTITNSSVPAIKNSEHGEPDEASSGVVTTSGTGTGVTGWRGPAPYRCGHCHQVSNWKHVIQRHCRLKHNGDIRIETVDRNSNKNSPVYHPLTTINSNNNNNSNTNNNNTSNTTNNISGPNVLSNSTNSNTSHHQNQTSSTNNSNNLDHNLPYDSSNHNHQIISATLGPNSKQTSNALNETNEIKMEKPSFENNNSNYNITNSTSQLSELLGYRKPLPQQQQQQQQNKQIISELQQQASLLPNTSIQGTNTTTNGSGSRLKQLPCPYCSVISESKSQMNYHISLFHKFKPDQYECQLCAFTCSKKPLLMQHYRAFHEDYNINAANTTISNNKNPITSPTNEAIDLRAKDNQTIATTSATTNTTESNDENGINVENFDKLLSFCPKCPARYIGCKELKLHLKSHESQFPYRCKVCSYTARQEPYLLSHLSVHTDGYQEKTQKLCKKFKIDNDFMQPKLCQIHDDTLNEKLWIIDISNDENSNSLLKRQLLEVSPKISLTIPTTTSITSTNHDDNAMTATNTTATCDNVTIEECLYCPYETTNQEQYKAHLKNHQIGRNDVQQIRSNSPKNNNKDNNISNNEEFSCEHCEDYKVSTESELKEHIKLHFKSIKNSKNVAFYTSFDTLELNIIKSPSEQNTNDEDKDDRNTNCNGNISSSSSSSNSYFNLHKNKKDIIKTIKFDMNHPSPLSPPNSSDEGLSSLETTRGANRQHQGATNDVTKCIKIVDVTTGEIIKSSTISSSSAATPAAATTTTKN